MNTNTNGTHKPIQVGKGAHGLTMCRNPQADAVRRECLKLLSDLPTIVETTELLERIQGHALWHYTQASFCFSRHRKPAGETKVPLGDKYACAYYSPAAWDRLDGVRTISGLLKGLRHEHVFARQELLELLREPGRDVARDIVPRLIACIVTSEEHTRLENDGKGNSGWSRYVAAGIGHIWQLDEAKGMFELVETKKLAAKQ